MSKYPALPKDTVVPKHVAIIPDGNRRWARAKGKKPWEGHQAGFSSLLELGRYLRHVGVSTFSIWCFSTENWDRPKFEVDFLMKLFEKVADEHLDEAIKEQIKISHFGRKDRLPETTRKKLEHVVAKTKDFSKYFFNICLDYGGHNELVRATDKLVKAGVKDINNNSFPHFLDSADIPYPNPDLIVRTSGEQRLSGFMPWQSAYSEIYWERLHFPDLTPLKLHEALVDFSRRRRRFGGNDGVAKNHYDAKKMAKTELGFWRAHHTKNSREMLKYLEDLHKLLYHLGNSSLKHTLDSLTRAIKEGHDAKAKDTYTKYLTEYYRVIQTETQLPFSPPVVAGYQVEADRLHDRLENDPDKKPLEEAFGRLYAEIFRLNLFQIQEAVHWRTIATVYHDLAEKEGTAKNEAEKCWKKAEEYLEKFYRALGEFIA